MAGAKNDSVKNRHDLLNAKANSPEELLKVATELRFFLEDVQSQNETWGKLRIKLYKKHPKFLQKVQIAFVYYYIRYLKQKYFRNEDFLNTADNSKKSLSAIKEELKKDNYSYFSYLCTQSINAEENSPFKDTRDIGTFLPSTIQLKQNILGSQETVDIKNMSIDDFYRKLNSVKDVEEDFLDFAKNAIFSNDPEEKLLVILINLGDNLEKTGSVFQVDLTKETTNFVKIYTKLSNDIKKKKFKDIVEKYNGKTFDKETLTAFKQDLIDINKEVVAKKEEAEENVSLEDQLAMNMADYISGRISATDFQKKDQQIRKSVNMSTENDTLKSLKEVDN